MGVESTGTGMVKTQSEMQAEGAATNEEAVGMQVDNLNTGAEVAGTVGTVAGVTGLVAKGCSALPGAAAVSIACDVTKAVSDATAGGLQAGASFTAGDDLGGVTALTDTAGGVASYGVEESSNDNGFLDKSSSGEETLAGENDTSKNVA